MFLLFINQTHTQPRYDILTVNYPQYVTSTILQQQQCNRRHPGYRADGSGFTF